MKEIVVLSGKGGTGKTSITAALAVVAGSDAIIADCDVDAANMHLLLEPDFKQKKEFYSGLLASINLDVCSLCGICAETCRFHAITLESGRYHVSKLDCEGCGFCARVCPENAISMDSRRSGYSFVSNTRIGNVLVHARLDIGAENSGKLVAGVKREAKALADIQNKKYLLVDGSPGIGCPVVSSLAGAHYVILVTEPTLSGIHDLKRIQSLIRRFRIKTGCIINKYDLNLEMSSEIEAYSAAQGIDLIARLPFDMAFNEAMLLGKTVTETDSRFRSDFQEIWNRIQWYLNQI
ncbi:MAG: ATP-binding protein [Bacteroidales bacterium]|jgi:MinD superfamily P-loop ATPase|nr:ATP-binding protein [Bacteroidales bacterium]